MSFTKNSDSIWWNIENGKRWKCNCMMCNRYPHKLMEINDVVWSCHKQPKKKSEQSSNPREREEFQVVGRQWRTVVNPMDEMCSFEKECMLGDRGHEALQCRSEIAAKSCISTILPVVLLLNSSLLFYHIYIYIYHGTNSELLLFFNQRWPGDALSFSKLLKSALLYMWEKKKA